jgi:glycerate-2-kinase
MNAARTRLSAIKGGRLAVRAGRSITFAISDVHAPVEDDPRVIGSGPTVADPPVAGAEFVLVGSRRDAMRGAREAAERLGYAVHVVHEPVVGEATVAAAAFVARARDLTARAAPPFCVMASGETTVTLPPEARGRGGRNQEFALAAALEFGAFADYAFASAGTDGIDGPTDAAGAVVDASTLVRAREKSLDAQRALQAHDTYPFFAALGDLIVTGPTGTNVGDVQLLLVGATGAA